MRKILRWAGIVVAALLGFILVAALIIWLLSARALSRSYDAEPEILARPSAAQLADAARQSRILGCTTCHGEGLRGAVVFDEQPFATVHAPNLTLIAATATDQQLAQAIRQGISHKNRALWIMPSGMYSRLSDSETAALIAYIRSQPRGGGTVPQVRLGPIARGLVAFGKFRPAPATIEEFRSETPLFVGKEHEAGRRLTATICSECHGPALGGSGASGQEAPDLRVASAYDIGQFKTMMRTGRGLSKPDLGLMSKIAKEDTKHMRDDELEAVHAYLVARAERVEP